MPQIKDWDRVPQLVLQVKFFGGSAYHRRDARGVSFVGKAAQERGD